MTKNLNSSQGEGSGARPCYNPTEEASWWCSTPLWPQQCVAVHLVLHRDARSTVAGVSLEVFDPHTRELLAASVNPSVKVSTSMPTSSYASTIVREMLSRLLEPDPF